MLGTYEGVSLISPSSCAHGEILIKTNITSQQRLKIALLSWRSLMMVDELLAASCARSCCSASNSSSSIDSLSWSFVAVELCINCDAIRRNKSICVPR